MIVEKQTIFQIYFGGGEQERKWISFADLIMGNTRIPYIDSLN